MIDGNEHEKLLAEFRRFETRMLDEGARLDARLKARRDRDQRQYEEIGYRIRDIDDGRNRRATENRELINTYRQVVTDARNLAQIESRKMSILIGPREVKVDAGITRFMYRSKWIEVHTSTEANDKPVNCVDLTVRYHRIYDVRRMQIDDNYTYDRQLFCKSFLSTEDAWTYYNRNKARIFKNSVVELIGDETVMDVNVNHGAVFDELFDFRLIYQSKTRRRINEETDKTEETSYRSFVYDRRDSREIEVLSMEKTVMEIAIIEHHWDRPDVTHNCILRYLCNQVIGVTCPIGKSSTGRTCYEEIHDAIYKGPLSQLCVEPDRIIKTIERTHR